MGEHFFVSYSRANGDKIGPDLADRLAAGVPSYRLWVDVLDLDVTGDWDDQIEDAIKQSSGLLLVMTPDSVRRGSGCKNEWVWALKYKKPVIPLMFDPRAGLPFRLGSRQYIDFTTNFDQGIARLRIFFGELHQPKGELRELRFRLVDAERELPRALDVSERARVEQDIADLRRQVAELEGVAADPAGAVEATTTRIETGLEGVRQPARPEPTLQARARFVNPAPLTAPTYFQDRHAETELLAGFLAEPEVRLVTVVGRGGVGKTAMACRLLKGLELGRLPDDLGEQRVDGIVYLRTPGAHPVSFANLFTDLCRLLASETADLLQQRYRDPQETPAGLMAGLLEAFPAGLTVVVLLDNFEDLLDETGAVTDSALDEGLRALLAAPAHGVKVVITTRMAPPSLLLHQPGGQRRIDLDEGLPSPYAEKVLRARDPDGRLGLKAAPDAVLGVLRARTRGYPRALEAVAAILSADRNTTLAELIGQTEKLPENVVEALVGEAFQRLDGLAQQVMQALAIFPVPVPAVGVDYVLQPFLPTINAAPVLARLVNMQFVRRDAGHYYLHQVDRDYALGQIPDGAADQDSDQASDQTAFTRHTLRARAADYFAQTQTPRAEWKTLDDLAAQLAEFDLRCQNGDYDTAAQVLFTIDFDYLITWGHYRYMIDLHARLHDHLTEPSTQATSLLNLGTCYSWLGQTGRAIDHYQQALTIDRDTGYRQGEATALGNLGTCYSELSQTQRAIDHYQQALTIFRDIGDRQGEASVLGSLANCYADLGQTGRAIDHHQQALTISRDIGNRQGEATHLGNLGNRYADLGQTGRAIDHYQQALTIVRDIGWRYGEANALNSLGPCYADLGQWPQAARHQRQAIEVGDEIGSAQVQAEARRDLAWTLLYAGDLRDAGAMADAAATYSYPSARAGAALVAGIVHLRQGNNQAAARAFQDAVTYADELLDHTPQNYEALDTKALALAGLTLTGPADHTAEAARLFTTARTITSAAGTTATVLRRLNTLTPTDPNKTLNRIRPAAGGLPD